MFTGLAQAQDAEIPKRMPGFGRLLQAFHISAITQPLTNKLKKDSFHWTPEAEEAFEHLKHVMTTAPVLALPDFTIPFTIAADASGVGIGAVLSQRKHPIA